MLAPGNDPMSYPDYFKELKFPLLASPKYDGIRALPKNSVVMSRTFKPIPNTEIQENFSKFNDLDGELIVGSS